MEAGGRVGEYVLKEKVGSGGFAEVWRAEHIEFPDKMVAVKIPTDAAYREYLRREGVAQNKLAHKNIVEILGGDTNAEPPYLLMEYVPCGSLRRLLREGGRVPFKRAMEIFGDVVEALQFAHSRGAVHCDIKPENILLAPDGTAKLSDFGLWRFKEDLARRTGLSISFLTDEQPKGGTVEYMSPEQRRGEEVAPSDDVYSLGVVLFEMLTGRLPAPGDKVSDFADVPLWADELFQRCYVRREKRLADGAAVRAFLDAVRSEPSPALPEIVDEPEDSVEDSGATEVSSVGCLHLIAIVLFGALGFSVGASLKGTVGAIAGAGIGMLIGARVTRPRILVVIVLFSSIGMILSPPIGGLLGAGLAELFIFISETTRQKTQSP